MDAQAKFVEQEFDSVAPAFSDESLALKFAATYANKLRFVAAWGKWLQWDGQRWYFDDTLAAFNFARTICRQAAEECNGKKDSIAKTLASAKTVAAVVTLARADRRLAATISQWDADPWLLNTPRGVVDLRTGKMREHRLTDYLTKMTAVAPDTADCPLWMEHLKRILNNNDDLVAYLQRVLGYSLTGLVNEHALFFCYGTGANGKGVTINTVARVIANYAQTATIETFTASHTDRHTTELAALRGARLVTST
jgi:putative DNA primase/helicase